MAKAKAQWTLGKPSAAVAADGTATVSVDLIDSKRAEGTLLFTMSADRVLTVTWAALPDAVGLTDFRAWSKES